MGILRKMFGSGKNKEEQRKSDKDRYDDLVKGGMSPGAAVWKVDYERKKRRQEASIPKPQEPKKPSTLKDKFYGAGKSIGGGVAAAGRIVASPQFQGFARAGANFSGMYGDAPKRKKKHKKEHKKGKKYGSKKYKKSRRSSPRSRQPASFFDMI